MKHRISKISSMFLMIAGVFALLTAFPESIQTQPAKPTVARMWQGRTSHAKADAYEKYLTQVGVAQMTSTAGNLGAQIFRRPTSEAVEFIVITYWESRDAIKKLTGDDIERAFSFPRDAEFLLEPVTTVRHYQVVHERQK